MNRQAQALQLADEILTDIELRRVDASALVMKASRLARLTGAEALTELTRFEAHGYPVSDQAERWMRRTRRWEDDEAMRNYAAIGTWVSFVETLRAKLEALNGMSFSGDMLIPVTNAHRADIDSTTAQLFKFLVVIDAVTAQVHKLVSQIYYELTFSEAQATLFEQVQHDTDAKLAADEGLLQKIENVMDRLRAGDPEAISGAMNSCRRLIDSVADTLFEPSPEPYEINPEHSLNVDQSHVLNRLQAYAHQCGATDSRRDRLRRALADIYGRVSAGVHTDVTIEEARFLFLHTYIVIGELLSLSTSMVDPDL